MNELTRALIKEFIRWGAITDVDQPPRDVTIRFVLIGSRLTSSVDAALNFNDDQGWRRVEFARGSLPRSGV